MSPRDTLDPQLYLEAMADNLVAAATLYRSAWRAHRRAVDEWQGALEGLAQYTEPAVANALAALNAAADAALLLDIEVGDDALEHMEDGSRQLEEVAAAARRLADALGTKEGGLQ